MLAIGMYANRLALARRSDHAAGRFAEIDLLRVHIHRSGEAKEIVHQGLDAYAGADDARRALANRRVAVRGEQLRRRLGSRQRITDPVRQPGTRGRDVLETPPFFVERCRSLPRGDAASGAGSESEQRQRRRDRPPRRQRCNCSGIADARGGPQADVKRRLAAGHVRRAGNLAPAWPQEKRHLQRCTGARLSGALNQPLVAAQLDCAHARIAGNELLQSMVRALRTGFAELALEIMRGPRQHAFAHRFIARAQRRAGDDTRGHHADRQQNGGGE